MGKPTKKIKFIESVEVTVLGERVFEAKAGEVRELSAASANRWLRRNKATDDIQGAVVEKEEVADEHETNKQDAPITEEDKELEKEREKERIAEMEKEEKPTPVRKTRARRKPAE